MWVCKIVEHDLPVVCETKEEAMEILEHWNNSSLEGEGEVSEYNFDFTFECGETKTVTSLILTCDDYEEDEPYAQAFLQDYKEYILKEDSKPVNKEEFHPAFAQQDSSDIIHCMRVKINPVAVAVLKQLVTKDISVETQTEVYDWISNNVKQYSDLIKKYSSVYNMLEENVINFGLTGKRPINIVIIGKHIKELLEQELNITNVSSSSYENHDIILSDKGTVYMYDRQDRIDHNSFIMCVNNNSIDSSGFIVEINGKKYLNPIEDVDGYSSFDDYIRIINVG